jgi:succinate dehydrogenase/fumarate reductase flavoprotein subunit
MLDLVVVDGRARGIITRNLVTGEARGHAADAVVLATGGYGNVFYLSTNAKGCNVTAIWRAHKKGALFANPCFTQIHPTCIPVSGDYQSKLTLMSESLRNDGRVWVPKNAATTLARRRSPRRARLLPRAIYPSFGNLVPRDVASRRAKRCATRAAASAEVGSVAACTSTSATRSSASASEDRRALRQPVRHVRAHHRRRPYRCRCASTRRSTTRWAACGWTTT